jgi:methyl-CpG-binding domain protein 4
MNKSKFVPLMSPYGLIQEHVCSDEWKVLVCCIMLNQTSRKQAERVLRQFFQLVPDAETCLITDDSVITATIASLGFKNRRTEAIKRMSKALLSRTWVHASQLPGIGVYGSRAWEIFCQGQLGTVPPEDGALKAYWEWANAQR